MISFSIPVKYAAVQDSCNFEPVSKDLSLFLFTFVNGPIELTETIVNTITNLSWWFFGLTVLSIYLYTRPGGVSKNQAYLLISSYVFFVIYIFWSASLSSTL